MLKVTDVDYCGGHTLRLKFNNGAVKTADLSPYLIGEVFGELRDESQFIQFGLTRYTIEWANGADFAPEFLYELPDVCTMRQGSSKN